MAPFVIWKQRQVLLRVHNDEELLPDEQRYMRRMAWRRIACSLLRVLGSVSIGSDGIVLPLLGKKKRALLDSNVNLPKKVSMLQDNCSQILAT